MERYSLNKVKKYAPDSKDFLLKSISLFVKESTAFSAELKQVIILKEFGELRQRIHKIKPSCELFDLPVSILKNLEEVYHFDLTNNVTDELIQKLEQLVEFFNELIEDLTNFLKTEK